MTGEETYRPVLVRDDHRDAVEAFAAALAEWDEQNKRLELERTARLADR